MLTWAWHDLNGEWGSKNMFAITSYIQLGFLIANFWTNEYFISPQHIVILAINYIENYTSEVTYL